jgi:EAL domain-containing protein (putative c-di-GMP-specific phosphodiesterase class I)
MFALRHTEQPPQINSNKLEMALSSKRLTEEIITTLLEKNHLTCHFQPIINLQQTKIFAY